MGTTALIITSTAAVGGKKLQKTLTDINPAASNEQLKSFAQQLNGLTTNNYGESNRLDKVNCDTEEGGGSGGGTGGKLFRNIEATNVTAGATATVSFNISAGETYKPIVFFWTSGGTTYIQATAATSDDPTVAKYTFAVPDSSGVAYIAATENDYFHSEMIRVTCS